MYVPKSYWGETSLTAVYLINHVSSLVLDNISHAQFFISRFPFVPIMQNLESRVFGYVFLWVILPIKEGTNVIILLVISTLSQRMSLFMKCVLLYLSSTS